MAWKVELNTPLDRALDVALQPVFTWTKTQLATSGGDPILINFTNQNVGAWTAPSGNVWNNVDPQANADSATSQDIANAKDINGLYTGVRIHPYGWDWCDPSNGVPAASEGLFADTGVSLSYVQSYAHDSFVELSGLTPGTEYVFYPLGMKSSGDSSNSFAFSDGNNATKEIIIDPSQNTVPDDYKTLQSLTIAADANGEVLLKVKGQYWGQLNALVIETSSGDDSLPASVIRVWDTESGNQVVVDETLATAETFTPATALDEMKEYRWGVSVDGGTTFVTREFTTMSNNPLTPPTPGGISDGATNVDFQPTFSWTATDGSSLFDLEYSTNPDFSGSLGVSRWLVENLASNSYTPPTNLTKDTTYYWRVRSTDNSQYDSQWSTVRSFNVKYGKPDAPILTSPAIGAQGVSLSHTFTWQNGGGAVSYDLYISTNTSFAKSPTATNLLQPNYTAQAGDLLNATTYYWKVVAKNVDGETESAVGNFISANPNVPYAPMLQDPKNAMKDVYLRPYFSWNQSAGATKYNIEISDNENFNNSIIYNNHTTTGLNITQFLKPNTKYFWRVAAGNNNGYGSFSAPNTFTTQASQTTNTPTLSSPTHRATGISLQPTFTWNWQSPSQTIGVNYGALPELSTRSIQSVVIDYASAPNAVKVGKAPLKYNKRGVVTASIDDGDLDDYTSTFQGSKQYTYTDGCGNEIPYSFALALFHVSPSNVDLHVPPYNPQVTYAQIAEMIEAGVAVANHGFKDADGQLSVSDAYLKWKTSKREAFPSGIVRGFNQKMYVGKNGNDWSGAAIANGAYGSEANTYGSNAAGYHEDAVNKVWGEDINKPIPYGYFARTYREFNYYTSEVDKLINPSNLSGFRWVNHGFHTPGNLLGLMSNFHAAHGASASDLGWFTSMQEFVEYIWAREYTILDVQTVGTRTTVTLDTTGLPDDMMWYALSLNIEADANISSITINGGINSGVRKNSYNINGQAALVNLQWNGQAYTPRLDMAAAKVDEAVSGGGQDAIDIAQCYLNLVPAGPDKTYQQNRLNAVGSASAPIVAENPGTIDEGSGINYDPENLPMTYDLQAFPSGNATNPVIDVEGLTAKQYQAAVSLASRTDYQWKVRAHNAVYESLWTDLNEFTTVYGPPDPPTIVKPTIGQGGISTNPLLEWAATGEVDGFSLQVTETFSNSLPVWTTLLHDTQLNAIANSYQLNNLQYNKTYAWRVKASNSYGDSTWVIGTFTTGSVPAPNTPTMLSPAEGALDISITPIFTWQAQERATAYRLRVIKASTGLTVADINGIASTSYTLQQELEYDTEYRWQLQALNDTGGSPWASAFNFATTVKPLPGKVVPNTPSDNAPAQPRVPVLSWYPDKNADNYLVEVSTDLADFNGSIFYSQTVTGTSHALNTQLEYSGTYYWRVTAQNTSGSAIPSDVRGFTVQAIPVPAAPTLVSPDDLSKSVSTLPTFNWLSESLSDSYVLEVKVEGTSWNTAMSFPVVGTSYTIKQADELAFSVNYQWRVYGVNSSGSGQYSVAKTFSTIGKPVPATPTLIAPTGVNAPVYPLFQWNEVPYADSFEIELQREGQKTPDLIQVDCPGGCTSYQYPEKLLHDTDYTWRLRAGNASGFSNWSALNYFTTETPEDLPIPLPETPVDGSTNMPRKPNLTWSYLEACDEFDLEVVTDVGFTNIIESVTLPYAERLYELVTELNYSTQYLWRIRAAKFYNDGTYRWLSNWSQIWDFTVKNPPMPEKPVISYPTGTEAPRKPLIQWNDTQDTDTYDIEVATDSGFANIIHAQAGLSASQYQIPVSGDYNTTYHVRVRSVNIFGNSGWATASYTTIELLAPGIPILQTPANNATGLTRSPDLRWSTATSSDSYELQVDTDPEFSSPFVFDNLGSTNKVVSGLSYSTLYYWRVRGKNEAFVGDWSSVFNFTVQNPPQPGVPILIAPSEAAVNVQLNPEFSWAATINTDRYLLELATDALMDNVIASIELPNDTNLATFNQNLDYLGTYFWRVTASNQWRSASSEVRQFTVMDAAVPTVPVLRTPVNNADAVVLRPTLTWDESFNADYYELQWGLTPQVGDAVEAPYWKMDSLTENNFTIQADLDFLTTYYWRVRARNQYKVSSWSQVFAFSTTDGPTPSKVSLVYPEDGKINVPKETTITWRATTKASYYEVEIAEDIDFTVNKLSKAVSGATRLDLSAYLENTKKYFWRVRAVNNQEIKYFGNWSDIRTFRIQSVPVDSVNELLASAIRFNIINCDSFIFEHDYRHQIFPLRNKKLVITFPDGNKLMYEDKKEELPGVISGNGNLGELSSRILSDLDELGYRVQAPSNIILMDLKTIQADTKLFPDMFVNQDGDVVKFQYAVMPDGIYKIEFGYTVGAVVEEAQTKGTLTINHAEQSTNYQFVHHIMNTCNSDSCINGKIEHLFEIKCRDNHNCKEREILRNQINDALMLKEGAKIDYAEKKYSEANSKLTSLKHLCSTGEIIYKKGC